MDTRFVRSDTGGGEAQGKRLLSLLSSHPHSSPPTPTRYWGAAIIFLWPLAMVGTFPNQTQQCFKNFPNEIEKEVVPTLQQEKTG